MTAVAWLWLAISFLAAGELVFAEPLRAAVADERDLSEMSLEDLMQIKIETVYGASKYWQRVTEAPSSVSIVTADEIRKYGYRTLAEVLRSVRSIQITYDRNYSYVGVRGLGRTGDYNSRVLVLIDGHRVNDNIYDSALVGSGFPLDVDLIDRVEVIRGPGSSLYGNDAFLAVVNVITRNGSDLMQGEVSGSGGSFNTFGGRVSVGNRFESGLDMVASGSLLDSKGQNLFIRQFSDLPTGNGVAKGCDIQRNYNLFSKLSYGDFTLEAAYVAMTKGIPTASYDTDFNDSRNRTTDKQGFLDLRYDRDLDTDSRVMARLFYDTAVYEGRYVYSGVLNRDFSKGGWWGGEVMVNRTLFAKHKVTLGAEYQKNTRQNQGNYDEHPFLMNLDDRRHSSRWAVYFQDEFPLVSSITFNGGIRYDYHDTFGANTNPRLALIYHPVEKSVFKVIYGTAFRAPNVFELFYSSFPNEGNPRLKPERIQTWEVVYEQYLGETFLLTMAGFRNRVTDLIESREDPDSGLLVFRNGDSAKAEGIELELDSKWDSGVSGKISYTVQRANDSKTGKSLSNSPEQTAKLNFIVPVVRQNVFLGIEEHYVSKRKTLSGAEVSDFFVTNVTVFSQKIMKGLEASVSVYNLFDERYVDPASTEHLQDVIEQDGRNCRFKVTYRF